MLEGNVSCQPWQDLIDQSVQTLYVFIALIHCESEARKPSYDGMLQCNLTMTVHQYVWCQVPFEDFFVLCFVLLFDYVV